MFFYFAYNALFTIFALSIFHFIVPPKPTISKWRKGFLLLRLHQMCHFRREAQLCPPGSTILYILTGKQLPRSSTTMRRKSDYSKTRIIDTIHGLLTIDLVISIYNSHGCFVYIRIVIIRSVKLAVLTVKFLNNYMSK